MQPALVLGTTRATIKHASLKGQRMLIVQPLGVADSADGPPLISVDQLGAGRGDRVMITSDGAFTRSLVGNPNTPVRWCTIGILDS
jgi:ethanolamine utilization protein EutN